MRGMRPALLAVLALALLCLSPGREPVVLSSDPLTAELTEAPSTSDCEPTLEPTFEQMIGQKLLITMTGSRVSAALAGRVRRGEIGGVVLLARNITTRSALRRLTRKLQRAAAEGGQPPLLISVDQEGGSVRRVPWAPPTLSVPEIGRLGSTTVARAQGALTGAALRRSGINVDLAPVADIPGSAASFMLQQGRTFSSDAKRTARLAAAFASGLASQGVLATMKHFPGIGMAVLDTDRFVSSISASRAALRSHLLPYRRAIRQGISLIMLSNARFPAYDSRNAAGWSHAIAVRLLRRNLGFTGVTMTDSLNGTAHARGLTVKTLAKRAAIAGTDMILMTGSERSSSRLYEWLLAQARDGSIPEATLRTSHDRIVALKEGLCGPGHSAGGSCGRAADGGSGRYPGVPGPPPPPPAPADTSPSPDCG